MTTQSLVTWSLPITPSLRRAVLDVAAKGYFFLDREGRIGRMIGFLGDVTAQKAAQDELARAHEGLELRVEQRRVREVDLAHRRESAVP